MASTVPENPSTTTEDATLDLERLRCEVASRIDPLVRDARDEPFEERCRLYLQALRWPARVECPRCSEHSRILWLESRSKWHCYSCRYQFSVTAGTLFHHSHLPVWKWLAAVHLTLDSPEGISASELRRRLGGSYKTSWFAAHRIRAAMRGRGDILLRSLIEADAAQPATPSAGVELRRDSSAEHLSRLVAGPHLHLSTKYLRAYLDERRWRFAHRSNPQAFRDTILALLGGERLPYVDLVAQR